MSRQLQNELTAVGVGLTLLAAVSTIYVICRIVYYMGGYVISLI